MVCILICQWPLTKLKYKDLYNLNVFDIHNSHLEGAFSEHDPYLRRLQNQPWVYRFPLMDCLPHMDVE